MIEFIGKKEAKRVFNKWYWILKFYPTLFFLVTPLFLLQYGYSADLAGLVVRWFSAVLLIAQVGSGGAEAITFQYHSLAPSKIQIVQKFSIVIGGFTGVVVIALLPGGNALMGQEGSFYLLNTLTLFTSGLLLCSAYGHSGAINKRLGSKEYVLSRDLYFLPLSLILILIEPSLFRLWAVAASLCQWLYNYLLRIEYLEMPCYRGIFNLPKISELKKEVLAGALLGFCGVGFVQVEGVVMGSVLEPQQFMIYNVILRMMTGIAMSTVFVGLETRHLLVNNLEFLGNKPLRSFSTTSRLFSRLALPIASITMFGLIYFGCRQNMLSFILIVGVPQLLLKLINVYSGPTFPALRFNGYNQRAAAWLCFELIFLFCILGLLKAYGFAWMYFFAALMVFAALRIITGILLCKGAFGRMLWI